MIEIIIFHVQDTNVQSEKFSKELLHYISHATQLSILHVSKVTKFSPECLAHEILIGSFSVYSNLLKMARVGEFPLSWFPEDRTQV